MCKYAEGQTKVHLKEPSDRRTLTHKHTSQFMITLECWSETWEHLPLNEHPHFPSPPSISSLFPSPPGSLSKQEPDNPFQIALYGGTSLEIIN